MAIVATSFLPMTRPRFSTLCRRLYRGDGARDIFRRLIPSRRTLMPPQPATRLSTLPTTIKATSTLRAEFPTSTVRTGSRSAMHTTSRFLCTRPASNAARWADGKSAASRFSRPEFRSPSTTPVQEPLFWGKEARRCWAQASRPGRRSEADYRLAIFTSAWPTDI